MDEWGESAPKRIKLSACKASSSNDVDENLAWSSLGDFNYLPNEMIFMSFNWLQIRELGDVALTSSIMHDYVCSYIQTRPGLRKVFHAWKFEKCDHDSCCGKHKPPEIAIFFRKLATFWPCRTKINFIAQVILKSNCLWNEECVERNVFFGTFIQFVMVNWTEAEKVLAHEMLESKSGKRKMLNEVLASPTGSMIEKEKNVRYYYQGLYLTSITKEFNANWFYLILKWQPYCYQAKILLLLFSPVNDEGQIVWGAFSEVTDNIPERQVIIHKAIHDITTALHSLKNSGLISFLDVMTVIEEIIVYPVLWYQLNVCEFVLCAGDEALHYILNSYLLAAQCEKFAIFVCTCSGLPICLKQAEVFSELVVRIISYIADDSNDRLLYLLLFYNFFQEYESIYPENRVMKTLMRALRRIFPTRRSRRLAMKR